MIHDLIIKKVTKHPADDGFFAELLKFGEETFHEVKQTSYSETLPGVVKAFHVHDYWEEWSVIKGEAVVVCHDGRKDSPTSGKTEVFRMGEKNLSVIAIPPNVLHGYKVVGKGPVGVIYHAEEAYDPKNPRIREVPHDDPDIGFDWSTIA